MLRRQCHACHPLQFATFYQGGDPAIQGTWMLFAGDGGNVLKLVRVLGQIVTLHQFRDQFLIRQLPGFAHAVDQDDSLELLPDLEVLQDRQKRRHARACG
ncbi:hypothetical protein D3C84_1012250 [compost metagenome]